jgi:hemerythrin-like domain-containing protein
MAEVLRSLRREHANMAKLLDVLERQIAVFNADGSADYDIIEAIVGYSLNYPDLCHYPKEDLVFRKLRARDAAAAKAVGDRHVEHEKLAALTRRFAAAVHQVLWDPEMPSGWFSRVVQDFVKSSRRHIHMQEEFFFPAAVRTLTAEDWTEIDTRLTDRVYPFFCDKVEKPFRALHNDILSLDRIGPDRWEATLRRILQIPRGGLCGRRGLASRPAGRA